MRRACMAAFPSTLGAALLVPGVRVASSAYIPIHAIPWFGAFAPRHLPAGVPFDLKCTVIAASCAAWCTTAFMVWRAVGDYRLARELARIETEMLDAFCRPSAPIVAGKD